MPQEIQSYPQEPMGALPAPAEPGQPSGTASIGRLLGILRRRWLTILAIWLPLAALAVAGVWMVKKPTYTASAQIQILPFVQPIIPDPTRQPIQQFDIFLRTQAELVSSNQVLTAALADASVRNLPLLNAPEPLSALRECLKAEALRNTQIIQINITRESAPEARALTKAVLEAYLYWVNDLEQKDERERRQVLDSKQKQLRDAVKRNQDEMLKLAGEFGTATESTFELLRQTIAESTLQTKQNLETVKLEIIQIEDQIKQIGDGSYTGLLPDETIAREQEGIENDPMVRSLREQLLSESARLARLKSGLTDEAKEVIKTREQIARLRAELEKERIRATDDLQKDTTATQKRMKDTLLSRKKLQLAAAERRRDELVKLVAAQDAKEMRIGRCSLEIQSLRGQIDGLNKDLELVEGRIKQLDMESQRPGRISRASDAEILPSGINDKRLKLSLAAGVGMLFFALAVAYLREQVDARVHTPNEVETDMGLRLLGVVPPVDELKSGRVTEEDFTECYRLVRVNLLSGVSGAPVPKAILVTSAQAGEGKTSLAVSLAASLAELGGRVLLIDGDIQAPRIGEVLSISGPNSLRDVLSGERALADCVLPSKLPGLDVLIARLNGASVRGTLDSRTSTRLVQEAAGLYDYIVIDSPPALGAADALVWAQAVDGTILSTFAGQSSVKAAQVACQRLKMVGASLLGAVICNLSSKAKFYSYSSTSVHSARSGARRSERHALPFVQLAAQSDKPAGPEETVDQDAGRS